MAISLARLQISKRKAPVILIYGPQGVGKNTFACCEHAPLSVESPPGAAREGVVVIQTEEGLGDIQAPAFPKALVFYDVMEALGSLYTEDHQFTTVVVDSLDWLEPLIWAHTCELNNWPDLESAGFGKGYTAADATWRQFFSAINDLRNDKGMTVIMTAHQQVITVEDPELPTYQTTEIKLHKRAAAIAKEYTDVILHASLKTLLANDASAKKAEVKKGEARQLAVTTGQRIITTQPKPGATAKNRFHLPAELPLCWASFADAMQASLNKVQTNQPTL